jgi:uncharacterized protein
MHKDLVQAIRKASGNPDSQVGGYLKVLNERFGLIERKLPVFAKPEAKRSRYYVTDNFLRSWLATLANPVSAIAFRPLPEFVDEADQRLADVENGSLEKLAGQLYEERSRNGVGDFSISHRVQGFWDKADTEFDLAAVNETTETIRFGSCKRSPGKLISDVNNFKQHVARLLQTMPKYQGRSSHLIAIAPLLDANRRATLTGHDIIPQDLNDLTQGLA